MLKQFTIDEQYITDVSVRVEHRQEIKDKHDLLKAIKNPVVMSSISSKDHDEFTKLRDQLESLGYIETQRSWWNGDRVLKSFKLNEWTFRRGHRFPCAAAMRVSITCARKNGWTSISHF
jgi:hypothetical protein